MSSSSSSTTREQIEYQIAYYINCAENYALTAKSFYKVENVVQKIEEEIEHYSNCYEIFVAKNGHSPHNTMMIEHGKEKIKSLVNKLEQLHNGDLSIQQEYIRKFEDMSKYGNKKNKELTKSLVDLMEEVTQNYDAHMKDVCDTLAKTTITRKRKRKRINVECDDTDEESDSAPKRRKL